MMEPKAPHALCEQCPLKDRTFVPTHFGENPGIAVIGEAPGFKEARNGKPFVGQSGRLLRTVLAQVGEEDYDNVFRTNVVACHPRGNATPNAEAIRCCAPRLENELDQFEGNTIIPVGATATEVITGKKGKQKDLRGRWASWKDKNVLPTWHPAFVLRFSGAIRDFQDDLRRAVKGTPDHPLAHPPEPIILRSLEEIQTTLDGISGRVAYDLETTGLQWYDKPGQKADQILMLGLSTSEGEYIIPRNFLTNPCIEEFFDHKGITFVAQNGKFDVLFLRKLGIMTPRVDFDTMLAEYVLWEMGGYGLEEMALRYYGLDNYKESIIGGYEWDEIPFEVLAQYCAWDCQITRQLSLDQDGLLTSQGLILDPFYDLVMPTSASATELEWNGMLIDAAYMEQRLEEFQGYADEQEARMQELSGLPELNPRSAQQVSPVIYEHFGVPRPKSRKVKPDSTSKEALRHVSQGEYPFVDALRAYRRVHKILSSYLRPLLENRDVNNRVHTNVLVQGTEIGRLSMKDPALQTLPRAKKDAIGAVVRGAVIARPGHVLVMADYSQAELRIAGAVSGEPFLLEAYANDRDLHMEVALALSGKDATQEDRSNAKRFNFAFIYGGTEYSFAEDANMSISAARAYVRRYQRLMSVLTQWKKDVFEEARKKGFVRSRTGRVRRFPLITRNNIKEVKKSAPHFLIAGPASDLTIMSMNKLSKRWPLVLNVHDSIVFEVPEADAEACKNDVKQTMLRIAEEWFPEVPWKVDVDVVDRWAKAPTDDEIRDALEKGVE